MSGKGRGHHKKHHGGGGGILGALKLARDITHIVTGPTHHHHTTHHYHAPAPKVVYVTKTVYVKEKEEDPKEPAQKEYSVEETTNQPQVEEKVPEIKEEVKQVTKEVVKQEQTPKINNSNNPPKTTTTNTINSNKPKIPLFGFLDNAKPKPQENKKISSFGNDLNQKGGSTFSSSSGIYSKNNINNTQNQNLQQPIIPLQPNIQANVPPGQGQTHPQYQSPQNDFPSQDQIQSQIIYPNQNLSQNNQNDFPSQNQAQYPPPPQNLNQFPPHQQINNQQFPPNSSLVSPNLQGQSIYSQQPSIHNSQAVLDKLSKMYPTNIYQQQPASNNNIYTNGGNNIYNSQNQNPTSNNNIYTNGGNNIYNNQNQGGNPFYRQRSIYDTFKNDNNPPRTIYSDLNNNNNNNNAQPIVDLPSENEVNKCNDPSGKAYYPNI